MTSQPQGTPSTLADLDRGISPARFSTFKNAARGDDDLARRLYVWNRDLSVAFLADIAILEVALRNAMNDVATAQWGTHWYSSRDVVLDDRSAGQLNAAWKYLPTATQRRASDPDVPGRLIAHCMFGFWTNLLDAGDHAGREPRKVRANYEDLWQVFKLAFPGGRIEARAQRTIIQNTAQQPTDAATRARLNATVFTRAWVHGICQNVNVLRNRVAHHEPVINGMPLNGQRQRMSAADAHEQCLLLARIIDRRLGTWLESNTSVPTLLSNRPT
ncbi:Abi family protein [Paenarthrobacter nicotinovorans]|uniref:Abi family protein n=1 Tax=Paenarthrobacter nicotinovorans TaxID=29320 RepID=UPI001C92ED01|nr:Abi family protein [Paenarthrobacter nicotinovorans]